MLLSQPISKSLARLPLEVPDGVVIYDGGYESLGITLTRSTVTNVLGPDGLLVEIPVNAWAHKYEFGGAHIGRQIEGPVTNICLWSEEGENAVWVVDEATVTVDTEVAPDGNTTAETITDNAVPSAHSIDQTISANNTDTHLGTAFVQAGTNDEMELRNGLAGNYVGVQLDLSTEATVTVTGGTGVVVGSGFINAGNGWYFVWISGSGIGDSSDTHLQVKLTSGGNITYEGTGDTLHAWGMGHNDDTSFPTSYIKTEGIAVTRAADVPTKASPPIPKTWLLDFRTALGSGEQVIGQYDDGTENNRYRVVRNSSNEVRLFVTVGGVEQIASGLLGGTVANDTPAKIVVRIDTNDFAITLNGAALVKDTAGSLPTLTTKRLGRDTTGNYHNSTLARETRWADGLADGVMRTLAA